MNNLKEELKKQARLELARRDFFEYCKLTASDFYKEDRLFLKQMCNDLQKFYESNKPEDKILVVNMPPRHRQIKNRWEASRMGIRKKQK